MAQIHQDDFVANDILGLFKDGRLDYRGVADLAKLSKDDLSKIAKVAKSSVRFDDAIPPLLAQRLHEVATIANLVAQYFEGDRYKVALWFELTNPHMGSISPNTLIRSNRAKYLLSFVLDSREAEQASLHDREKNTNNLALNR